MEHPSRSQHLHQPSSQSVQSGQPDISAASTSRLHCSTSGTSKPQSTSTPTQQPASAIRPTGHLYSLNQPTSSFRQWNIQAAVNIYTNPAASQCNPANRTSLQPQPADFIVPPVEHPSRSRHLHQPTQQPASAIRPTGHLYSLNQPTSSFRQWNIQAAVNVYTNPAASQCNPANRTSLQPQPADFIVPPVELPSRSQHLHQPSNPAVHVSRGILPADIKEHWLSPPAFLFKPKESWSTFLNTEKANTTMARQTIQPVVAAKNFSKWTKLLKATAQVFRFIEILRTKSKRAFNINDVENARNHLIQVSQQNSFGPSIALLNKNKNLPSKDKLLPLSPFLKDNILRVGGRTKRSTLGYNTKHPIVLNAKESIARLFLEKCHEICMHFGTEYVKNIVQQSYYVFGLRDSLRSISYKCFEC